MAARYTVAIDASFFTLREEHVTDAALAALIEECTPWLASIGLTFEMLADAQFGATFRVFCAQFDALTTKAIPENISGRQESIFYVRYDYFTMLHVCPGTHSVAFPEWTESVVNLSAGCAAPAAAALFFLFTIGGREWPCTRFHCPCALNCDLCVRSPTQAVVETYRFRNPKSVGIVAPPRAIVTGTLPNSGSAHPRQGMGHVRIAHV